MKFVLNFYDKIDEISILIDKNEDYIHLIHKLKLKCNIINNENAVIIIYLGSILNKSTNFRILPEIVNCVVFIDKKINNLGNQVNTNRLLNSLIVQRQLMLTNRLINNIVHREYDAYDRGSTNYSSINGSILSQNDSGALLSDITSSENPNRNLYNFSVRYGERNLNIMSNDISGNYNSVNGIDTSINHVNNPISTMYNNYLHNDPSTNTVTSSMDMVNQYVQNINTISNSDISNNTLNFDLINQYRQRIQDLMTGIRPVVYNIDHVSHPGTHQGTHQGNHSGNNTNTQLLDTMVDYYQNFANYTSIDNQLSSNLNNNLENETISLGTIGQIEDDIDDELDNELDDEFDNELDNESNTDIDEIEDDDYVDVNENTNIIENSMENVNHLSNNIDPTLSIEESSNDYISAIVNANVYTVQISVLNSMGYMDNNLNELALTSTNGNVSDAIDFIESLR